MVTVCHAVRAVESAAMTTARHDAAALHAFAQALDPGAFGGREVFLRHMDWLAQACGQAKPRPGTRGARLPGERGLALARAIG